MTSEQFIEVTDTIVVMWKHDLRASVAETLGQYSGPVQAALAAAVAVVLQDDGSRFASWLFLMQI